MDFNCEKGFISKLVETKDIRAVTDNQIKPSYFTGEDKRVFSYIQQQIRDNGAVPTVRAIEHKFPDYEFYTYKKSGSKIKVVGTEEVIAYWCEELIKKVRHNKLVDAIEKAAESLDDLDTDTAYGALKQDLARIETDTTVKESVQANDKSEERKKAYLKRVNSGGMEGISTGFDLLDYITKGWIDGCLITIVASTGIGKTWLEVLFGSNALLQGCTVAQFVTEMSTALMQDRYDAMLFSKLHKKGMNYKRFKSGRLPKEQQEEYFYFLDEEYPQLEPLWLETATGVIALEQRVKEINPDIVLVDAVYLMDDDQNAKDDWLRVAHITRDLKKLAKRINKPIIINTQLDENTAKKASPKLGDIKYTQAIGQDSDIVMALYRDEVMINDREMGLSVLKNREGEGGKLTLDWDFSCMHFDEIYGDVHTEEEGEDEADDLVNNNTLSIDD